MKIVWAGPAQYFACLWLMGFVSWEIFMLNLGDPGAITVFWWVAVLGFPFTFLSVRSIYRFLVPPEPDYTLLPEAQYYVVFNDDPRFDANRLTTIAAYTSRAYAEAACDFCNQLDAMGGGFHLVLDHQPAVSQPLNPARLEAALRAAEQFLDDNN